MKNLMYFQCHKSCDGSGASGGAKKI
jgi:hypothetical protein